VLWAATVFWGVESMRWCERAFTFVELTVAMAIVAVLMGLLLPSLQAAREASRRAACQSNLKTVALAVCDYNAARDQFPVGSQSQASTSSQGGTHGVSWWVSILPHFERCIVYEQLEKRSAYSGFVLMHTKNGKVVDGLVIPTMLCPASSIPPLWSVGGFQVMMPSFVGISGAASDSEFSESRLSDCCGSQPAGKISAGGILVSNQAIRSTDVTDGTSNTIMIGEISDYSSTPGGTLHRIDGGFPNGWLLGTSTLGTPPSYGQPSTPSWNTTTIEYPVNTRFHGRPGIDSNYGPNNPLSSPHPGGVHAARADGSVKYVSEDWDVLPAKQFATRDDGSW
jgi:prepilin-type N-terminal cleavage/methylation domain-containing protein